MAIQTFGIDYVTVQGKLKGFHLLEHADSIVELVLDEAGIVNALLLHQGIDASALAVTDYGYRLGRKIVLNRAGAETARNFTHQDAAISIAWDKHAEASEKKLTRYAESWAKSFDRNENRGSFRWVTQASLGMKNKVRDRWDGYFG